MRLVERPRPGRAGRPSGRCTGASVGSVRATRARATSTAETGREPSDQGIAGRTASVSRRPRSADSSRAASWPGRLPLRRLLVVARQDRQVEEPRHPLVGRRADPGADRRREVVDGDVERRPAANASAYAPRPPPGRARPGAPRSGASSRSAPLASRRLLRERPRPARRTARGPRGRPDGRGPAARGRGGSSGRVRTARGRTPARSGCRRRSPACRPGRDSRAVARPARGGAGGPFSPSPSSSAALPSSKRRRLTWSSSPGQPGFRVWTRRTHSKARA